MDINKPVTNPDLVASMNRLKKTYNEGNERDFFHKLVTANFLAPVILTSKPTNNNQKTVPKNGTTIDFLGITNSENESFLPTFSDWEELRKWHKGSTIQTVVMTFDDYKKMIANSSSWTGLALNPFGENLVLTKDQMTKISNTARIEKDESVIIGIPKDYPRKMVDAIKSCLPKLAQVSSVYLLTMVRNNTDESYLIVIDADGEENNVFKEVGNVARKYLNNDEKVDFVSLSDSFGKEVVKDHKPIYQKCHC